MITVIEAITDRRGDWIDERDHVPDVDVRPHLVFFSEDTLRDNRPVGHRNCRLSTDETLLQDVVTEHTRSEDNEDVARQTRPEEQLDDVLVVEGE